MSELVLLLVEMGKLIQVRLVKLVLLMSELVFLLVEMESKKLEKLV